MSFVVSQGMVADLSRPRTSVTNSIQITQSYSADYAKIWETHGSVRTVTTFLARNVASLGLHIFERVADQDRHRITDGPLADLLGRPAPWLTRYAFWEALVSDIAVYDRYLALKVKVDGSTAGLVRIPPSQWTPDGNDWVTPSRFKVRGTNGTTFYDAADCFFLLGYSPTGALGGSSPIEALRLVLAEEYEAGKMREQMFRNGARTAGYIERPSSNWSTEAFERFKQSWREQYQGTNGSDAYGTPVLEDSMKYVPASQSAKDLQYIESRKLTREEVAAAYFIPPPMVGLLDHATFSNIKEQHKHLYQDTLGPWLERLEQEVELQLVPDLGGGRKLYVEFNLEAKLRGSFEEQATQLQAATGGPWMTRNEARAYNNLPAIDGGDELIVPLNVVEGGQASPQDSGSQNLRAAARAPRTKSADAEAPQEEYSTRLAKVFKAFHEEQRADVLARWGSKAPDWWDAKRWDERLEEVVLDASLEITPEVAAGVLKEMGEKPTAYRVGRTVAYLRKVAARVAKDVNASVLASLTAALDTEDSAAAGAAVFDEAEDSGALRNGLAVASTCVAFATVEAARQTRGSTAQKRWQVNSSNPRASHAAMDGETRGVDEEFSNGLLWPGAFSSDVDEVAGCTCSVVIVT